MYRPISEERQQAIKETYQALEILQDVLRSDVARRILTAATCGETPFSVDRVLDDVLREDSTYRSEGRHHKMPLEKIKRDF